ncbi:MAG: Hpt domain-containing protein [Helicobacteraceae bacterium]|nr:Hpt domain-containing protein [Helicobacteraceae bacterium]
MTLPNYSNLNVEDLAVKIGLKAKHIVLLIASYKEESETILANLKTAIDANDFKNIQMHAHSIKGSSGNLKFDEIYESAKAMELAAKDQVAGYNYSETFEALKNSISTISLAS